MQSWLFLINSSFEEWKSLFAEGDGGGKLDLGGFTESRQSHEIDETQCNKSDWTRLESRWNWKN